MMHKQTVSLRAYSISDWSDFQMTINHNCSLLAGIHVWKTFGLKVILYYISIKQMSKLISQVFYHKYILNPGRTAILLTTTHWPWPRQRPEHTCWWSRCSSSWAGSHNWAPRRRAGLSGRREPTRCGWPRGTWRPGCPESGTYWGACVSCGWYPGDLPVPLTR